jgi:hypothetical protein
VTAASLVRPVLWLTFPAVRAAAHAMWAAPGLRDRYPAYLSAMHGLIRASVPLMETAVERCGRLADGDPAAGPLAAYLRTHIAEEQGHDDWLLEDLALLGAAGPDELLAPALREDIAALAGAQYYLIRHSHPACLLGYIAVLEGCPPDAGVAALLPALTGWPAPAFRTVARHAALDPGHEQELVEVLDALPLSPAVTEAVARNAAYTALRAADLLGRLAQGGLTAGGRP